MPAGHSASHSLGRWGEDAARQFLEKCGYRCLDRRFRRPGGEIDLVMVRDGLVAFVEVKTRGPRCPVPPEAWVTPHQLKRLRRMAAIWMMENQGTARRGFRFDVVAVNYGGKEGGSEIRHLVGVG
ncbi:MAG: YraN family protein [Candidatus Krumholzibacteriota bacterium]